MRQQMSRIVPVAVALLLGAAAAQAQGPQGAGPQGAGQQGMGPQGAGPDGQGSERRRPRGPQEAMTRMLDLNQAQQEKLREILDQQRPQREALHEKMSANRDALHQLLESGSADAKRRAARSRSACSRSAAARPISRVQRYCRKPSTPSSSVKSASTSHGPRSRVVAIGASLSAVASWLWAAAAGVYKPYSEIAAS